MNQYVCVCVVVVVVWCGVVRCGVVVVVVVWCGGGGGAVWCVFMTQLLAPLLALQKVSRKLLRASKIA